MIDYDCDVSMDVICDGCGKRLYEESKIYCSDCAGIDNTHEDERPLCSEKSLLQKEREWNEIVAKMNGSREAINDV
jgi:hypothetical protein